MPSQLRRLQPRRQLPRKIHHHLQTVILLTPSQQRKHQPRRPLRRIHPLIVIPIHLMPSQSRKLLQQRRQPLLHLTLIPKVKSQLRLTRNPKRKKKLKTSMMESLNSLSKDFPSIPMKTVLENSSVLTVNFPSASSLLQEVYQRVKLSLNSETTRLLEKH